MSIANRESVGTEDIVNLVVDEMMSFDELGHKVAFKEEMKMLLDEKIENDVLVEAGDFDGG